MALSRSMRLLLMPLTVVVSNATGFLLVPIVSHLLAAEEFGRFSLLWSNGSLVALIIFEWLRLATFRLATSYSGEGFEARRETIRFMYLVCTMGCIAVALVSVLLDHVDIASLMLFAATLSIFEGRQMFSRAELDDKRYISGSLLRAVLSLAFVWSSGFLRDGRLAFTALSLSYLVAALVVYASDIRHLFQRMRLHTTALKAVITYGAYMSVTGVLSFAMPVIARNMAVHALGREDTAGFLLATDIAQRLSIGIGLSISLLLLPLSIKFASGALERNGPQTIRQNIVGLGAVLVPAMVGFHIVANDLMSLFLDPDLIAQFSRSIGISLVAFSLITLRIYGIDSVFVVAGRGEHSVFGPLAGLVAAVLAGFALPALGIRGLEAYTAAILIGAVVAFVAAAALSRLKIRWSLPVWDMGWIAGSVLLMVLGIHFVQSLWPHYRLLLALCVGPILYAAAMLSGYKLGLFRSVLAFPGSK